MAVRKALFFDIDGTLWDWNNKIPESTVQALYRLRKNGHLTFLCSGRSRAYIQNPRLFEIGFDGVVSGCGTMIEYGDKTVFYKKLDEYFPGIKNRYIKEFGNTYWCSSPNQALLWKAFKKESIKNNIMYDHSQIDEFIIKRYKKEQLSLF